MSPLLACSGHLLIDLPIFMGPVVVLAGGLLAMSRRARRAERPAQSTVERTEHADPTMFGLQA